MNWGIGYKNELLERIPEDMKFFKQTTLGKVVIMGRKTFESLPGQKPLKDRTNIILSKSANFSNKDIKVCCSLSELSNELEKYSTDDVFVIGGESTYSLLLPYCSEAYVTKIEKSYIADKYFVNLDNEKSWTKLYEGETKINNDIRYKILKYGNNEVISIL